MTVSNFWVLTVAIQAPSKRSDAEEIRILQKGLKEKVNFKFNKLKI